MVTDSFQVTTIVIVTTVNKHGIVLGLLQLTKLQPLKLNMFVT